VVLLFTLDIASHSTGEVTTAGQTKLVQHLEGGIVRRILVREEAVKAGEPLVEVERTAAESDMRELDAQLGALQIKALRLEAQLTRKSDFKVPADLAKRFPDQVETARALLLAQKSRVGSSYEAQSQKISQRSAEQAELQARRAHTEGKLRLLRQQIEINQKLLAEALPTATSTSTC
jgi:adhesin transport system membrane fusion protein